MKVLFAWARNHIVLHMSIEREVNFIVNLDINLRRTLVKKVPAYTNKIRLDLILRIVKDIFLSYFSADS